jgi:hypothetical protein
MTVEEYIAIPSGFLIPKYSLERAVRNLDRLEALALIRAACHTDGAYATLADAKEIYASIMANA